MYRRSARDPVRVLTIITLIVPVLVASAPQGSAVTNTCRARNVTKDTAARSDLKTVIEAASAGDVIAVKNVCVGNFRVTKRLTLVGRPTDTVAKPVLHANGSGRPLYVSATVTLRNLKITGGSVSGEKWGGGIYNDLGTLRLFDTVVRDNHADVVGGIYTDGDLTLNGRSAVRSNIADDSVGGIWLASANTTLVLNETSSITGNHSVNGSGGIGSYSGTIVLNDSAVVSGNAAAVGGGIGAQFSAVTMNDFSRVSGNTALHGAGLFIDLGAGWLQMNGFSSVSGNMARGSGGGLYVGRDSSATLSDSATITGNTADADDADGGDGGGIFVACTGSLIGAVDGGNVNDNYLGTSEPVEDNIYLTVC